MLLNIIISTTPNTGQCYFDQIASYISSNAPKRVDAKFINLGGEKYQIPGGTWRIDVAINTST